MKTTKALSVSAVVLSVLCAGALFFLPGFFSPLSRRGWTC